MQIEETLIPIEREELPIPWGVREIIYAILAVILITLGMVWVSQHSEIRVGTILMLYELIYLVPVVVIVLIKKINWRLLGLRRFSFEDLAIGCGIFVAAYFVIILHNLALIFLGIAPQSEYLAEIFGMDINIWILGISVMIAAPVAEEIFFRSFVYGGLADQYGWKKAAFISSFLFAAAHMQLVALIPTFLMGLVLAYTYQRSKSVIPGIVLHFAVNAFGFTMICLANFLQANFPGL